MCGIVGYLGDAPDGLLAAMTASLVHRGPNDDGFYFDRDGGLGFGFRRLSIIDVSGGHQPIPNETGEIVVVCNGEIYNHLDLRAELEGLGHVFRTRSDAEVVVHGWEQWGTGVLNRIEGMFFVALWDKRDRTLLLARDHLGKKPVHYTEIDGTLYFASEIRAFYRHPQFDPKVDWGCVDDYLSFRHVPGQRIMLSNVETLQPGHYLLCRDGRREVAAYWRLQFADDALGLSDEAYLDRFSALLRQAVRRRLMSEVPLGMYLSGGLDSSTIAALIAEGGGSGLTAFSHGFDNQADETSYAARVAEYTGANLSLVPIRPDDIDHLPNVVQEMEMPIANSDIIGFHRLAQAARAAGITVILSGEGADEIFGSYVHQKSLIRGAAVKKLMPAFLRRLGAKAMGAVPLGLLNALFPYPGYKLDPASVSRLSAYLRAGSLSEEYFSINALFSPDEKRSLFSAFLAGQTSSDTVARTELRRIFDGHEPESVHKRLISAEYKYWLPTYHLLKEDKISMAHSLELRFPFLDKNLVEFCAGLPGHLLRKGSVTKVLLRQATQYLLPPEIVNRPKGPILVPINACFGQRFEQMARDLLTPDRLKKRGLFSPAHVEHLFRERQDNPFLYDRQLFALVVLELWFSRFIDRDGGPP